MRRHTPRRIRSRVAGLSTRTRAHSSARLGCLLAVSVAGVLAFVPGAAAAVIDATLVEDTYLSSDATENNTNFSTDTVLKFRTHSSTWRNPLLQFQLPLLPTGEGVSKVELILTSASNPAGTGGTPDVEVLGTATAVNLGTVTYNNANPSLHTGGESGTSALLWSSAWTDFTNDGVIDGADFAVGQSITYTGTNATQGLRKFVSDHISTSGNATVTLGLGFITREGQGGSTSTGWTLYSQEGAGAAPILRITTEPIPEPAGLGLIGLSGALLLARRRRRSVGC